MDITKKYKIISVPTLLFFKHGVLVDKKTGVIRQRKIEKKLTPLLDYSIEKANENRVNGFFKLPWK